MFIFLLKQTVCPSASIHAINWSLCSLLLEQGDRPRKGDCFVHGSVILAAAHALALLVFCLKKKKNTH